MAAGRYSQTAPAATIIMAIVNFGCFRENLSARKPDFSMGKIFKIQDIVYLSYRADLHGGWTAPTAGRK
jgi:hypothetical protein